MAVDSVVPHMMQHFSDWGPRKNIFNQGHVMSFQEIREDTENNFIPASLSLHVFVFPSTEVEGMRYCTNA
jgi:hypothetical protein